MVKILGELIGDFTNLLLLGALQTGQGALSPLSTRVRHSLRMGRFGTISETRGHDAWEREKHWS